MKDEAEFLKNLNCVTLGVSNRLRDGRYVYFYESDGMKNHSTEISQIIDGTISSFRTKHGFHYVNFRLRSESEYRELYSLTRKRFGGYYDNPDEHKHFVLRLSPKWNINVNGASESISPRYVDTVFREDGMPCELSGQHLIVYVKVCGLPHDVKKLLRVSGVVVDAPLTFTAYRTRD